MSACLNVDETQSSESASELPKAGDSALAKDGDDEIEFQPGGSVIVHLACRRLPLLVISEDMRAALVAEVLDVIAGRRDVEPRMLLRVVKIYRINLTASHAQELYKYINDRLIEEKVFGVAYGLIEYYKLHDHFPESEFFQKLLDNSEWQLAERIALRHASIEDQNGEDDKQEDGSDASSNRREDRLILVHAIISRAVEREQYKLASRLVRSYKLADRYPYVERLYKEGTLRKLCKTQKWVVAAAFVGGDRALQTLLAKELLAAGRYLQVKEMRERYNLQDEIPEMTEEFLLKQKEYIREKYLGLPIPSENVWVVNDEQSLFQAGMLLHMSGKESGCDGPSVVGLDVEWKPNLFGGQSAVRASLLQIATRTHALLFDLLALHDGAFDKMLTTLFTSTSIIKLGFGFGHDLKVLHSSFPHLTCFLHVHSLLELNEYSRFFHSRESVKSLTRLCQTVLGKPLNKDEQMSDWEARPLSAEQIRYAALDAVCLVNIFDTFSHQYASTMNESKVNVRGTGQGQRSAKVGLEWQPWLKSLSHERSPKDIVIGKTSLLFVYSASHSYPHQDQSIVLIQEPPLAVPSQQTATLLGPSDVQEFLHAAGKPHIEIFSVDLLKERTSNGRDSVAVKSLALNCGDRPVIAILPEHHYLDFARLASALKAPRKRIRMSFREECAKIFGYLPGAIPPIGHRERYITVVDRSLSAYKSLRAGGGSVDMIMSCTFEELMELTNGLVADIRAQEAASALPALPQSISSSPAELQFVADSMMGRLARWLRVMGVDVIHWIPPQSHDDRSKILELAEKERRIILTRDQKLVSRRDAGACYLLHSNHTQEQFEDVVRHFGIVFDEAEFMSRCSQCNGKGFRRVDAEVVRSREEVKEKVFELVDEFFECLHCRKVYWEGPKYNEARSKFCQMFNHLISTWDNHKSNVSSHDAARSNVDGDQTDTVDVPNAISGLELNIDEITLDDCEVLVD